MSITTDYTGQTFVAFSDISGFKSMMANETRLMRAMDALYSSGYRNLGGTNRNPVVEGIFISDCGILFSRRINEPDIQALGSLLQVLAVIHRDVFESAFSLTTSIAFGRFTYRGKIEFEGLEKNAIHGDAYVSAYRDNESKTRKLYPNECRICKEGLSEFMTAEQILTPDVGNESGKKTNTFTLSG